MRKRAMSAAELTRREDQPRRQTHTKTPTITALPGGFHRISGLVVECIVAIDVTRVRFPADAFCAGRDSVGCIRSLVTWSCMLRAVTAALSLGTWRSGITPAQHAGGPGFNPHCVHFHQENHVGSHAALGDAV